MGGFEERGRREVDRGAGVVSHRPQREKVDADLGVVVGFCCDGATLTSLSSMFSSNLRKSILERGCVHGATERI